MENGPPTSLPSLNLALFFTTTIPCATMRFPNSLTSGKAPGHLEDRAEHFRPSCGTCETEHRHRCDRQDCLGNVIGQAVLQGASPASESASAASPSGVLDQGKLNGLLHLRSLKAHIRRNLLMPKCFQRRLVSTCSRICYPFELKGALLVPRQGYLQNGWHCGRTTQEQ